MAKTPCAACGAVRPTSRSSLPPGQFRCQGCRRAARRRVCGRCGKGFERLSGDYCSPECWYASSGSPGDRQERQAERYRAKSRQRRAKLRGAATAPYTTAEIAFRDRDTCGICTRPVDMTLSGRAEWGPTVDHVVPLSRGGTDVPENVQLAHRKCNNMKGSRVP